MSQGKFTETSAQVIERVRQFSPRILLSFSLGKDSIAAWLACRHKFDEIVPVYMYLVPGLEFVDESVAYYEKAFGTKIWQMPHPSLVRMLNNFIYQPPERCRIIEEQEIEDFDYSDVADSIREHCGLPDTALSATGVRAADSPMRYMAFKKHGAINYTAKTFAAVFDWKKQDVYEAIKRAGIKLPVDYKVFGRTFDGIDLRFLLQIKKHFPRDYQRIIEWFPLADLEVFRYEKRAQA